MQHLPSLCLFILFQVNYVHMKILCRLEWMIWNPYHFEFHFASPVNVLLVKYHEAKKSEPSFWKKTLQYMICIKSTQEIRVGFFYWCSWYGHHQSLICNVHWIILQAQLTKICIISLSLDCTFSFFVWYGSEHSHFLWLWSESRLKAHVRP